MSIKLGKGSHRFKEGGCLMEIVSMIFGRKFAFERGVVIPYWMWEEKSHYPACISPTIARACQLVNDALPYPERQRLALLIPRIMRAQAREPDVERRIAIRLALWAARSAEHLLEPDDKLLTRFHRALELSEARLWSDEGELDDDDWQPGWVGACHAAAQAATSPNGALHGVVLSLEYGRQDDLVLWLDSLLDAWQKAVVEEGGALYDPTIDYPPDDEVQAVIDSILSPG